MPSQVESAAALFLSRSDYAFDECSQGILRLDRIIVATHSSLVDYARGYLLPALYAYWERFFRIVFAEYLSAVSASGEDLLYLSSSLAELRFTWELKQLVQKARAQHFYEICAGRSPEELRMMFWRLLNNFERFADFSVTDDWIKTYANVGFEVLEENCKTLGIDFTQIKAEFTTASLYQSLKTLVDDRNDIAHGLGFYRYTATQWTDAVAFVLKLIGTLQNHLYRNLSQSRLEFIARHVTDYQI